MSSITLKRSAATLGVVLAGLLAAAGPASAQFWEGTSLRSQAPINVEPQMSLTGWPDSPINDAHSASAQIMPGMVGVKSPTDPASGFIAPIGSDKGSLKAAGTETGNPERSGPALAPSRVGAFALELEGKIVGAKAPAPASCLVDFASGVCYFHTVKAPASPTSLVFTSVSNVVGGLVPGGAIISA